MRTAARELRVRFSIDQDVLRRVVSEIRDNPAVEVGGKFVGFVDGEFCSTATDWQRQLAELHVRVEAYLDPGPRVDRSATHHYSDVDYQHELFLELSREFESVQFIGLWHSHHPNGLPVLSAGDAETGRSIVDSSNHELDLLVSSLATDRHGLRPGSHHLFLRGHPCHYRIDPSCVEVVDAPGQLRRAVDSAARRVRRRVTAPGSDAGRGPSGTPPWTTTPSGRALLAADQSWLAEYPDLRPVVNSGRLLWRGAIAHEGTTINCSYIYPADGPDGVPSAAASVEVDGFTVRNVAELGVSETKDVEFRMLLENVTELGRRLAAIRQNGTAHIADPQA